MKTTLTFHSYLLLAGATAWAEDRPNIVFILADDLGYGDVVGFNKDSRVPTPRLDQLAREGMRFTNAHASTSVCSPTRYVHLTGRNAGIADSPPLPGK